VTYRFARFSLNSDTRELVADGGEVRVSPKALDLLLLLVEHRSKAISKAEIMERLWPATFVGEANLATLVAELRRALGDSATDPHFVRTVHRFGYRFVADVIDAPPGGAPGDARMYLIAADRRFPLSQGAADIGRSSEAAVRIDAAGVSRRHARIVVAGDEARVEDLGSKNGTFVDAKPVAGACLLKDGDEIRVGPVALTFRIVTPTRATDTMNSS
jgi:DNA-binding winged helix-turn-helix (wHTH) protein